jgi:Phage integrase SAM-like domain
VPICEWGEGKVKGKGMYAKMYNDRITSSLLTVREQLETLRVKATNNCSEVKNEIMGCIKTKITGKAPRGQKQDFLSKLKLHTMDSIKLSYFSYKGQCSGRKRVYERALRIFYNYFNNELPLISSIQKKDIEGFKKWYTNSYPNIKQNTTTTYFSMIAAVFKHAEREGVIIKSPIPENFRGGFVDGNREVLSEKECLQIIGLQDNNLSETEKTAKYCL